VLPRLIRDTTPKGSDRNEPPPPDVSSNGHGTASGGAAPPHVEDKV
jgi:hypothetical protein